jgi:hypothetical protein
MTPADTCWTIEAAAVQEIDRLVAADKHRRIRDTAGFKWLALNNLRIGLGRLDAEELAKLTTMSGAEIMTRFPGPTP